MDKRMNIEGSPASKMVQLIRKHGHNREMSIEVATVVSALPSLKLQLPDGLTLERSDLIIAEHLTDHERTISYMGGNVSGAVNGYHEPGTLTSLNISNGKLTVKSSIKPGDKVIVIGDDDSQFYYVIDKAVM